MKNEVYQIMLNTRKNNKAGMGVISHEQGIERMSKYNDPEVETFLEVQTKSGTARTD